MAKQNKAVAAKAAARNAAKAPKAKAAPAAVAPVAVAAPTRLPFTQAKALNYANGMLAPKAKVVAAKVVLTAKGTNKPKARVYGYGNGGKVPLTAMLVLVPGFTGVPKGVAPAQWQQLGTLAAKGTATVNALYTAGITSRTVRRAYRAGAVNFVQA